MIFKFILKKRLKATSEIKSFKKKLDLAIKSIDMEVVQNLMSAVKGKVRKFGRSEEI